jgi:hypothetical protein
MTSMGLGQAVDASPAAVAFVVDSVYESFAAVDQAGVVNLKLSTSTSRFLLAEPKKVGLVLEDRAAWNCMPAINAC